ncbi:MAG TPA: hypothetical protein VFR38_14770 [Gaiellaceae bacterium]|nr:hypothetical protein [Gaiellaceae bacterium]
MRSAAELVDRVEFTDEYAPWHDVFSATASALAREARERSGYRAPLAAEPA